MVPREVTATDDTWMKFHGAGKPAALFRGAGQSTSLYGRAGASVAPRWAPIDCVSARPIVAAAKTMES